MTKFTTLDGIEIKEGKKTVFTHFIDGNSMKIIGAHLRPTDYQNVLYLGESEGVAVFKAWDNGKDAGFYIGTKGDEF